MKIHKKFPETKLILIFFCFLREKYHLDPANIGRKNLGKFPEKSRKFPEKLRSFQKKKRKRQPKLGEITAGFFLDSNGFYQKECWVIYFNFVCNIKCENIFLNDESYFLRLKFFSYNWLNIVSVLICLSSHLCFNSSTAYLKIIDIKTKRILF